MTKGSPVDSRMVKVFGLFEADEEQFQEKNSNLGVYRGRQKGAVE